LEEAALEARNKAEESEKAGKQLQEQEERHNKRV
jgi:hypothetical protein